MSDLIVLVTGMKTNAFGVGENIMRGKRTKTGFKVYLVQDGPMKTQYDNKYNYCGKRELLKIKINA